MKNKKMDVRYFLRILKHRWLTIMFSTSVLLLSTSYVVINVLEPTYEASESILVGQLQREEGQYGAIEENNMLLASTMDFLRSPMVLTSVANELNLENQFLHEQISLSHNERSQIINIIVHDSDPEQARGIAQSMASITVNIMNQSFNVENLEVLSNSSSEVIPQRIDNPNLNLVIAVILSIAFGFGMALVRHHFDDTIRETNEIEDELGIVILGEVRLTKYQQSSASVRKHKKKTEQNDDAENSEVQIRAYKAEDF